MSTKDYLKYAFTKVWRDKRNIFLLIILIIGTTTLLCSLYYRNFKKYNIDYSMQKDIGFRQVYFLPTIEDREKYGYPFNNSNNPVLKLPHVVETFPMNYNVPYVENITIEDKLYKGFLALRYGSKYNLPLNIEGETFSEDATGVAICPKNMFLSKDDGITSLPNSSNPLGTSFTISEFIYKFSPDGETVIRSDERYNKTYKIIGTYDSKENGNYYDECFISPKDAAEFWKETNGEISDLATSSMIAVVDEVKNVDSVVNKLAGKNYSTGVVTIIMWEYIYKILAICDIIALVASYAILVIVLFFYKKKSIRESFAIGKYKALGLKNKEIKIINLVENAILTIISFAISCGLLELFIYGVKSYFYKTSPSEMLFYPRFFSTYLIGIIVIVIIPVIISNMRLKKQLNKNVITLIEAK